jgi:hypothetical protein
MSETVVEPQAPAKKVKTIIEPPTTAQAVKNLLESVEATIEKKQQFAFILAVTDALQRKMVNAFDGVANAVSEGDVGEILKRSKLATRYGTLHMEVNNAAEPYYEFSINKEIHDQHAAEHEQKLREHLAGLHDVEGEVVELELLKGSKPKADA